MIFDPRPKTKRSDLFDREEELSRFEESISRRDPLILLLGLRRTGKTSLLLTGLNELKVNYLLVDLRVLEEKLQITRRDIAFLLEKAVVDFLRRTSFKERITKYLEKIEGLRIAGFEVKVDWRTKPYYFISDLFHALNSWAEDTGEYVVVAFDEAQELARAYRVGFDRILSYVYDYLRNISIVLTGSKIGLLYRFLRIGDPEAPLYGRARLEVKLDYFTREMSLEFLRKGFEEQGIAVSENTLEKVVDVLNGVPGWLALYGYYAVRYSVSNDVLERVLREASAVALNELKHFLELRYQARSRYLTILKYLASVEYAVWSEIKRYLESREGVAIDDKTFSRLLKNLVDTGFVEKSSKGYRIADPALKYSLREIVS